MEWLWGVQWGLSGASSVMGPFGSGTHPTAVTLT